MRRLLLIQLLAALASGASAQSMGASPYSRAASPCSRTVEERRFSAA
jgi:hypothetical protein